jgi:putative tricarboxylic transport membrane protein
MAKKGLAGPALGIAAFGSFFAGTFGVILLMLAAPPLANFALRFGPPEYFAVMFAALTIVTYLARGSMLKAWVMVAFGTLLGTVGLDLFTGKERLTLGILTLQEGLGIAPVVMGIFGLGEIFINIEERSC